MSQRLNYAEMAPELTRKLTEMSMSLDKLSLSPTILALAHHRASQINGCAFCLDLDVKKAKLRGERELRVYHISVWRDSPLFTEQERAALEWTEAVTKLTDRGISDEIFESVSKHFSQKELSELTFAIGIINTWNRLNVAFRTTPGALDAMLGLTKSGLN
ncbi:carboxymuconolactone decarboxylase family protein [Bdellovibrio sp. 22V]|uniref:carboxymuconolactone decarboxylase family protein n=1 Tax=Bdellovibrio sp. 22V TaxID=3044166 RepID=UPI002542BBBF|nr:carboxymuconolactone decarboxylase family protein [Bdellovibrio sp. 22V]WII72139.1 carboxymuconolactone decarboxylase family protein [Bdellovibrio sp. 22V]